MNFTLDVKSPSLSLSQLLNEEITRNPSTQPIKTDEIPINLLLNLNPTKRPFNTQKLPYEFKKLDTKLNELK